MNRLIIGIAGGTGSGKTTVATNIMQRLDLDSVTILEQDAYYYDLTDLAPAQRERCNFDHPDSIEVGLFVEHIRALQAGQEIERPVYDFTVHARTTETVLTIPRNVVIVEGILLFHFPETRALLDIKIFVDTPSDICLLRRITRDIHERGRTLDSVTQQYLETVRPMHEEFVEPSKRHADVIIPEGGYNDIAIDMVASRIRLLRGVAM